MGNFLSGIYGWEEQPTLPDLPPGPQLSPARISTSGENFYIEESRMHHNYMSNRLEAELQRAEIQARIEAERLRTQQMEYRARIASDAVVMARIQSQNTQSTRNITQNLDNTVLSNASDDFDAIPSVSGVRNQPNINRGDDIIYSRPGNQPNINRGDDIIYYRPGNQPSRNRDEDSGQENQRNRQRNEDGSAVKEETDDDDEEDDATDESTDENGNDSDDEADDSDKDKARNKKRKKKTKHGSGTKNKPPKKKKK